jgi:hypothetical protein
MRSETSATPFRRDDEFEVISAKNVIPAQAGIQRLSLCMRSPKLCVINTDQTFAF